MQGLSTKLINSSSPKNFETLSNITVELQSNNACNIRSCIMYQWCWYSCFTLTTPVASDPVWAHDDVIKWKHFPRNWPFVRGIHRSRWIPHTKATDAELWLFFYLRLNKRLSKHSCGCWFEALSWSLWRHHNDTVSVMTVDTQTTYRVRALPSKEGEATLHTDSFARQLFYFPGVIDIHLVIICYWIRNILYMNNVCNPTCLIYIRDGAVYNRQCKHHSLIKIVYVLYEMSLLYSHLKSFSLCFYLPRLKRIIYKFIFLFHHTVCRNAATGHSHLTVFVIYLMLANVL